MLRDKISMRNKDYICFKQLEWAVYTKNSELLKILISKYDSQYYNYDLICKVENDYAYLATKDYHRYFYHSKDIETIITTLNNTQE